MKVNLVLLVSALFSVAAATPIFDTSHNEVTKLYPVKSAEKYRKDAPDKEGKSFKIIPFYENGPPAPPPPPPRRLPYQPHQAPLPKGPYQDAEIKVILLGKDENAREIIQEFLDERNPSSIKAIFLVQDNREKLAIAELLHQDGGEINGQKAVKIVKYNMAKQIVSKLLATNDEVEEIKAVLIVKDTQSKGIIESLLATDDMQNDVRVVLIGKDSQAKEIIERLLVKEEAPSGLLIKLADNLDFSDPPTRFLAKAEEVAMYNKEKDDKAKDLIQKMFYPVVPAVDEEVKVIRPVNKVKEMVHELLGQDAKIKKIMDVFSDGRSKEMLGQLLGQDDKVQKIMTTLSKLDDKLDTSNATGSTSMTLSEQFLAEQLRNEQFMTDQLGSKDVNDGLLERNEETRTCGIPNYQEQSTEAANSVEWFMARLRGFIGEQRFDYQRFESSGKMLQKNLDDVELVVDNVTPCNMDLVKQHAFVKSMFQAMGDAIELLKHYETAEFPGHEVVYSIVDLNVRLLGLRNVRGEPDMYMSGYAERLRTMVQFVNMWQAEFRNHDSAPFGTQLFFQKQFDNAEAALIALAHPIVKG